MRGRGGITLSDVTAASPNSDFSPFDKNSDVMYSKASYYTTLALYSPSFPGLWSTTKRSTKQNSRR